MRGRQGTAAGLAWACLLLAWPAAGAPAGDGFLGAGPPAHTLDTQFGATPAAQAKDPSVLDQRLRAAYVLSQASSATWVLQQSFEEFDLSRRPVIPATGRLVPGSLWTVDTGAGYSRKLGERREWGASASVGSASDQLYHGLRETTLRATGVYRMPSRGENSWLFLLAYSNNRHFANNIPLPGAAYIVRSKAAGLDAAIGLPFLAVSYRPAPGWSGKLSIFGPDNLNAEVGCPLAGSAEAYAGFDWSQKEWLRADRADREERLFFDRKRWILGLRLPVWDSLRFDLSGAYEFNRRFYEDRRARSSGASEAGLAAAWTVAAKLGMRWQP